MEVSVKDDGRVELLLVLHDGLVGLLGDHGRGSVVLGVDIGVKVVDDVREGLLGLLVKVGDCRSKRESRKSAQLETGPLLDRHTGNSSSKDRIVWVLGGEVRSSLGSEVLCERRRVQKRKTKVRPPPT